jgi:hypothetical protein
MILRGQDARPEAVQHKTFQYMTGEILPACLDTLRNIIGQMNRDFHTSPYESTSISLCTIAGERPPSNLGQPCCPVSSVRGR